MAAERKLHPVHPGEVLLEEFLKPMSLSQTHLAQEIGVPPRRINEIVLGKRRVTADTALRLARYFGTSARFWLGAVTTLNPADSSRSDCCCRKSASSSTTRMV